MKFDMPLNEETKPYWWSIFACDQQKPKHPIDQWVALKVIPLIYLQEITADTEKVK